MTPPPAQILREPVGDLAAHVALPIRFTVRSRLEVEALRAGRFLELPVEPFEKDYDVPREDNIAAFARGFDTANWVLVAAYDGEARVGGALVARDTPGVHLLEGRRDLATILDVRVAPEWRGAGVGRLLMREVIRWAREHGCTELTVETQEINVAACRFYSAMGFRVGSVEPGAYGPQLDEAKVIWRVALDGEPC